MKRWYVVQVHPGYEEVVRKDLLRRIQESGDARFGDVLVPSATVKNFFSMDDQEQDEKLFPGYILVEMEKHQDVINVVVSTPRVSRFLGGNDPSPLTKKEVDRVLGQINGEVVVASQVKNEFVVGGEVDIHDGPFAGFVGIIDSIDEGNERLKVMVSIFGRLTPVELNFDQVKK